MTEGTIEVELSSLRRRQATACEFLIGYTSSEAARNLIDASLAFHRRVAYRYLGTETYMVWIDAASAYKSRKITSIEIYATIQRIFLDAPGLIEDFKQFVPSVLEKERLLKDTLVDLFRCDLEDAFSFETLKSLSPVEVSDMLALCRVQQRLRQYIVDALDLKPFVKPSSGIAPGDLVASLHPCLSLLAKLPCDPTQSTCDVYLAIALDLQIQLSPLQHLVLAHRLEQLRPGTTSS